MPNLEERDFLTLIIIFVWLSLVTGVLVIYLYCLIKLTCTRQVSQADLVIIMNELSRLENTST